MSERHQQTLIIAEAGVNHNGSPNLALQLVEIAAKAKADIVKFRPSKPTASSAAMPRRPNTRPSRQTPASPSSTWCVN